MAVSTQEVTSPVNLPAFCCM